MLYLLNLVQTPVRRLNEWQDEDVQCDDNELNLGEVLSVELIVGSGPLILRSHSQLVRKSVIKCLLELQLDGPLLGLHRGYLGGHGRGYCRRIDMRPDIAFLLSHAAHLPDEC